MKPAWISRMKDRQERVRRKQAESFREAYLAMSRNFRAALNKRMREPSPGGMISDENGYPV